MKLNVKLSKIRDALLVILALAAAASCAFCVLAACTDLFVPAKEFAQVVVYEGPKPVPASAIAQMKVDGAELFVFDTAVNNTHKWKDNYRPALSAAPVTSFDFEGGIALLDPNAWCMELYNCDDVRVDNVKIITARPNGDGITVQSCRDVTVSNCFVRTWDDSLVVKNYSSNKGSDSARITFRNCQIWTDLAQSMEIGYETNKGGKLLPTI